MLKAFCFKPNNVVIRGVAICRKASSSPQSIAIPGIPSCSIYLGNLPDHFTNLKIHELLVAKEVTGSYIPRLAVDKRNGKCKGYGFLDFDSIDEATKALTALSDVDIEDKKLLSNYCLKDEKFDKHYEYLKTTQYSLFIRNLPNKHNKESLANLIKEILSKGSTFKLLNSKVGYAHVLFSSEEERNTALAALNLRDIDGRFIKVKIVNGNDEGLAKSYKKNPSMDVIVE